MRKKGFTLIELLVVISIIAVLMAILMPALRKVKTQARAVMCSSNLKQWYIYFNLYGEDNSSKMMVAQSLGMVEGEGTWIVSLEPYYKGGGEEARLCPEARFPPDTLKPLAQTYWDLKIRDREYANSYGINNWVYGHEQQKIFNDSIYDVSGKRRDWGGTLLVKGAAQVPMFMDARRYGGSPLIRSYVPRADEETKADRQDRFNINRHSGNINVVFLDGSAEKVGLKQIWDLNWHRTYYKTVSLPVWPDWMKGFKD